MKKIFLSIVIIFISIFTLSAQQTAEFETTIYVMDLNGNMDSVVIGYDAAATFEIDAQFGETNIINQPWDSIFEVRVSPTDDNQFINTYKGKKQIVPLDCSDPFFSYRTLTLGIRTNTPVVITWNMQDFQDDCRDSSAIVDNNIFFQYPLFGYGRSLMAQRPNHGSTFDLPNYFYSYYQGNIEGGGTDTIFNVFIGFIDDLNDLVSTEQQKQLQSQTKTYPNPTTDNFTIELPESYFSESVQIFDITGREVYQSVEKSNQINVPSETWAKGIYFYKVWLDDGIVTSGKVVKN